MKNQAGMTLVETVVAMGLLGLIVLGSLSAMTFVNHGQARQQLGAVRSEVINRIRDMTVNSAALKQSAILTRTMGTDGIAPVLSGGTSSFLRYDMLARCLPAVADAAGCDKTAMDDPTRGNYFYLTKQGSTDPAQAIAGENIYYSSYGRRCSSAEAAAASTCPFYARVWAEPFCLNFGTNCNKALSVIVRYSVGIRSDYPRQYAIPPLEGEIHVPLQRGVQLTRVLSHTSTPLNLNGAGIYTVPKYMGYAGQSVMGLRFEAMLESPEGLVSMKLQMRSLAGTDAYGLNDESVPNALLSKPWVDVTAFPAINMVNAQRGQLIIFGTHGGTNLNWPITGGYSLDANGPVAPAFKSGFYQFRALATDVNGGLMESSNLFTVRILPSPQVLFRDAPNQEIERNCTEGSSHTFNYWSVDDEGLTEVVTALTGPAGFGAPATQTESLTGTHPTIQSGSLTFEKDELQGNYQLRITVKNYFVGPMEIALGYRMKEVATGWRIADAPSSVRVNNTTTVSASYTTGSCCGTTPSISWTYLNVPEVGNVPMFSGPATSSLSCSTIGNSRTCSTSVTATGITPGPTIASNNIRASVVFDSAPSTACSLNGYDYYSRYIKVIPIPEIAFYKPESLFVRLPTSSNPLANNPQSFTPRVRLRIDYPPDEEVRVKVVRSGTDEAVCGDVVFAAGSGNTPVDQPCDLPLDYSGDLVIVPVSSNVATPVDTASSNFKARLASGRIQHRTCQPSLTSHPSFPALYDIPATHPMTASPWGAGITPADAGNWDAGGQKRLRCYDNWTDSGFPMNIGNPVFGNWQDGFYSLDRNYEVNLASNGGYRWPFRAVSINFSKFHFPKNSSNELDFSAANIPRIFVVTRGASSTVKFGVNRINGASQSTDELSMTDRTGEFCSGGSQLSTIRIYEKAFMGFDIAGFGTMEGVDKIRSGEVNQIGYSFVCTYGKWNPVGSAYSPNGSD